MQAIILSGGLGTRLRPLTDTIPKPMLPIGGIPHLEYQIQLLKSHGITDIILSTRYLHEKIVSHFGNGEHFGVSITYCEDGEKELGTGGAIFNSLQHVTSDEVIVLNGDILTDINLTEMYEHHKWCRRPVTIALTSVENPQDYGVAIIERVSRIARFIEKPDRFYTNLVNAGVYVLDVAYYKEMTKCFFPDRYGFMIENTFFPHVAELGNVSCYARLMYWLDIGTFERYAQAQVDVASKKIIL